MTPCVNKSVNKLRIDTQYLMNFIAEVQNPGTIHSDSQVRSLLNQGRIKAGKPLVVWDFKGNLSEIIPVTNRT